VNQEPGAFLRVVDLTLTRTIFIGPGIWAAGIREPKQLVKATLGASLTITGGLALVYWLRKRRGQAILSAPPPAPAAAGTWRASAFPY
jgi:hypothetical protein